MNIHGSRRMKPTNVRGVTMKFQIPESACVTGQIIIFNVQNYNQSLNWWSKGGMWVRRHEKQAERDQHTDSGLTYSEIETF